MEQRDSTHCQKFCFGNEKKNKKNLSTGEGRWRIEKWKHSRKKKQAEAEGGEERRKSAAVVAAASYQGKVLKEETDIKAITFDKNDLMEFPSFTFRVMEPLECGRHISFLILFQLKPLHSPSMRRYTAYQWVRIELFQPKGVLSVLSSSQASSMALHGTAFDY